MNSSLIETTAQAREHVAHWRGARPGRSPATWRWIAEGRRTNAAMDRNRGRTQAAAIEIEIAEIFEAAAVEREQEIAARDAEYDGLARAEAIASEAYMREMGKKHRG